MLTRVLEENEESELGGVPCETNEEDGIASNDKREAVIAGIAYIFDEHLLEHSEKGARTD